MDTYPEESQLIDNNAILSYDDTTTYEEQASLLDQPLQAGGTNGRHGAGNKMYMYADSTLPGVRPDKSGRGKVRVWFLGWIHCG